MSIYLIRKLARRDASLSAASRDRLLAILDNPQSVEAGADIVRGGSRPNKCTLVVSGWACRYNMLSDGRRQTLALHVAGDFVDLHSFPIKVMDHSVAAVTDCTISTVPHARIQEITDVDPHLTRVLWMHTLIDAAILRQWLLSAGRRSALEHAAHLLCELYVRMRYVGLAPEGGEFDLPLSQEELAEAIGISAVHVSRTLTELRNRNLFLWRGGKASILDFPGLQRLAEFDPTYLSLNDEPR